jgi:hypothetical protein
MTITYKYTITSVDEATKTMEISYEADGYPTMSASGRLPYEGETTESVVAMYSPVRVWEYMNKTSVLPEVGMTGVIAPQLPPVTALDILQPTTYEV